ncbi:uncharacterized protein LOC132287073 [Cornus florida]|uniref:uncharacterized protein LOC132287073 n=1 Tax=Cornus florida TaxID=4283 RepID=UPI0028A094EE|nr:uncharacterized protein LOC132287073 [Cornus florida]
MSNNLMWQQLPNKIDQMEPVSNNPASSISETRMGMTGPMSSFAASQQLVTSGHQMGQMVPMPNDPGSQRLLVLNKKILQMDPGWRDLVSQQLLMPDQQVGGMEAMSNTLGPQKLLLPSKRRDPMSNNSVSQQISIPNKQMTQMEPLSSAAEFQQSSAPHKKTVQMHSMSRTPRMPNSTTQNKRMVRNESLHRKSGSQQSQTPKNRTAQMEPSPKVQTESFESVRSKMRESIAAALALVSEPHDKAPNVEKSEVAITPELTQEVSQPAESTSTSADVADHLFTNPTCTFSFKESCSADKFNDEQSTSQETLTKESMGDSANTWKCDGQELQCDNILSDKDVSFSNNFFVKDEFLQGNGLSWVVDLDMDVAETNEVHIAKKPKLIHGDGGGNREEQAIRTPQKLALLVEAELFKLFGGVNKKYKEKGRSLLFNLKDRNNPELRERVLSCEISPEKLCSMTAEELASKELSQWRMAKAEELAQMVVLPESDVDIRRLVRKTHKGEFQVEIEQDDGVSVEVSVGTSSLTPIRSKNKQTKAQTPSKSDGTEDTENVVGYRSSSENQDLSGSLSIPSDGTDLMDELKDAESLPPIVSLDEFMESLDSEPPFENLPAGGGKKPESNMESMDADYKLVAASKDPVNSTPDKTDEKAETDKMDGKYTELDMRLNSSESPIEPKTHPPGGESKVEHIWEGVLKLNISAMVTVFGCFKSGEKTSTKDWPNTLEIKGRVRLDAFKKFLQELPMSRSRAVMVVQFVLKERSSENERASLSEVVDSYILEERLGFAEAAPGVEIYICPPHTKILEILSSHLHEEDHTQPLKSTDNGGLIGVVVWRRAHPTSTISPPNSSSRHKHTTKNPHSRSRTHPGGDTNFNFASKPARPQPQPQPQPPPDEDDDIPPGFGLAAASRDEDDLPEFNFSGRLTPSVPKLPIQNPLQVSGMTSQAPSHPVDHVRELIHKYGQPGSITQNKGGTGVGGIQWNDDGDDDDIPEWRPEAPEQQPPPQPPRHGFGQQPMLASVVNQQLGPTMPQQPRVQVPAPTAIHRRPLQPSVSAMQLQGAWLARPPAPHGLQRGSLGSRPSLGQYYGVPVLQAGQSGMVWRQGAPSSRGF